MHTGTGVVRTVMLRILAVTSTTLLKSCSVPSMRLPMKSGGIYAILAGLAKRCIEGKV